MLQWDEIQNDWEDEGYYNAIFRQDHYMCMQYTGLLDKHGKEVFEGDIVRWRNENWPVFWSEKLCRYMIGTPRGCEIITKGKGKHIEVIGNIYENKDLLEAK
jgi:hypothetical protein